MLLNDLHVFYMFHLFKHWGLGEPEVLWKVPDAKIERFSPVSKVLPLQRGKDKHAPVGFTSHVMCAR